MLSVLQQEFDVPLQDAADYVGVHFKDLVHKFEMGKTRMPSFGTEVDAVVLSVIPFEPLFFLPLTLSIPDNSTLCWNTGSWGISSGALRRVAILARMVPK